MPTVTDLLDGHEALRGQALRDRLTEARRAAAATASPAALAEIDAVGVAATQACIRSYVALLPRSLADLPAAAATGAVRAAARPAAPMRKLPVPLRPADADARPAMAAPAVPVASAPAAAPDASGTPGTAPDVPAAPPARPAPAPSRLGNLRRPLPALEPDEPEAPAAPVMVRNPLVPPGPTEGPACDAVKLAAHRRRHGASSWPFLLPNGEYNYEIPWLDPAYDLITF